MDLSPGYREWAPPPGLGLAVSRLWSRTVPEALDSPSPYVVLPDACVDLIWQAGRGAFVAGPDTEAWHSSVTPGTTMVGVRFAPGAGGAAFRIGLDSIRNQRIDMADIVPRVARSLVDDLPPERAPDILVRAAGALIEAGPPDDTVQGAAALLADPAVRLDTVTHRLGLSARQLRRRFHTAVGYGPKMLQRVLRLRRFLAGVAAGETRDLAQLAHLAGYADQAHLTRECQQLARMTPTALAAWQRGL